MRKWKDLKGAKKKSRRALHAAWDFLRRSVWGGYRRGGLCGLYHWVRCHVWNRYHIFNISGEDGYDWGWIDRDQALLMVSFAVLRDFVEKEDPKIGLRTLDDYMCKCNEPECNSHDNELNCMIESTKAQIEREKEVRALYDWWTKDRKREHEECLELLSGVEVSFGKNTVNVSDQKKSKSWYDRDQEFHQKDEDMLIRLAKIRLCLWT